ncbi:Nucleolar protein 16 [Onygenales sp. PD_40]|nr:Nucleolar protein 16 [Onygenales sp. PD_40]KAK2802182.1 Nucleolar protein 16 [Onygenales sp. PD_10]
MGRELQKRKNRSGAPRVKQKTKRLKNGNKKIDVLGNAIIAQNWDKKLTLTQNYRRLGLTSKLNASTGGAEKKRAALASLDDSIAQTPADPLHVLTSATAGTKLKPTEARVERDPETGKILRVIHDDEVEIAGRKRRKANPLEDPLNELSGDEGAVPMPVATSTPTAVVQALERQAALEEEALKKRQPRQQSKGEGEWLARLVAKHGDNVSAMVRDRKLNPMQQTEGDIRRRLRKWKEKQG